MAAQLNFIDNGVHTLQKALLLLTLLLTHTQARIGYFWHITDLHLDTIYSTEGDVLRSCWDMERQSPSSSTRSPGRFGDYLCDSPWSLIESAAKAMKSRQGDNVEFVLWTGDGLSHSAHPLFETKKLEILRNITDLLGRTFSSQFVFPVLGHEDGSTNFRHLGELWRHWLPSEALHTFEKGGYYSIEQTKSRLRIIALNTNFMRHDPKYSQSHLAAVRQRTSPNTMMGVSGVDSPEYRNYYYHHGTLHQHHGHGVDWSGHGYGHHRGISAIPGGSGGAAGNGGMMDSNGARVSALSEYENQDTEKQWIWLEDVLFKSKNSKETVYIVGHIPPGSDERHLGLQQNGHTTFTESNNKRYLDLVRKYSSIIQGQFFGHLHSDSFRIIYDDKGTPVSWIMISPSVTPRKMSVGSNNPAMRLYKFDTDSGQVLDYTQYYMDLQLANTLGEPNWVPEYNLTHYYALSDISAISLHNFVDRFTGSDTSWFSKYYRANAVRYQTNPCEGVCMLNHYCAITRVDYKEFRQCLEKEQGALSSQACTAALNAAALCPLLLLVGSLLVSCGRSAVTVLPRLAARLLRKRGHAAAYSAGCARFWCSSTNSKKAHQVTLRSEQEQAAEQGGYAVMQRAACTCLQQRCTTPLAAAKSVRTMASQADCAFGARPLSGVLHKGNLMPLQNECATNEQDNHSNKCTQPSTGRRPTAAYRISRSSSNSSCTLALALWPLYPPVSRDGGIGFNVAVDDAFAVFGQKNASRFVVRLMVELLHAFFVSLALELHATLIKTLRSLRQQHRQTQRCNTITTHTMALYGRH